jgi:hypothetical protein
MFAERTAESGGGVPEPSHALRYAAFFASHNPSLIYDRTSMLKPSAGPRERLLARRAMD